MNRTMNRTTVRSLRFFGARTSTAVEWSKKASTGTGAASGSKRRLFPNAFVHRRGDHPYGSREYLLVEPMLEHHIDTTNSLVGADGSPLKLLASIQAHRNIVFGAKLNEAMVAQPSEPSDRESPITLANTCRLLVRASLDDCYNDGEQPQAISTLHGLSAYVQACIRGELESHAWNQLRSSNNAMSTNDESDTNIVEEAVRAIATGIPRPGHSVVGQGTYRDGAVGWEAMAREFVLQDTNATLVSEECQLYQDAGAQLVQIELLADTTPAYLHSAGGAMARFFFL